MWRVRYTVVDVRGGPIADARIAIDCHHVGDADRVETTDRSGVSAFEIPAHGSPPRPEFVVATVIVSRAAYADAMELLECRLFTSTGGVADRRVVLNAGGAVRVFVTDRSGAAVASAVVLFHLDRSSVPVGADGISPSTVTHYRRVTDPKGEVALESLFLGDWLVSAGNWRDWEGASPEDVMVDADAPREVRLGVERWDTDTYVSGRVASPSLSGNGGDPTEAFRLRSRESPLRTKAIYDDGAFFMQLAGEMPESWELLRGDGTICSQPISLVHGDHAVVIAPTCAQER